MNKSIKILLISTVGLIIGLLVLLVLRLNSNPPQTVIKESNEEAHMVVKEVNQQLIRKNSLITADPKNPSILIYTSYALGIEFKYLQDGGVGFSSLRPYENGNKIYFDNSNYIRVFDKSPEETIEQALRKAIPEQFNSEYCTLVQYPYDKNAGSIIWDERISVSEFGNDMAPGAGLKSVCNPTMSLVFKTDPAFPTKVYYINYETQAVSFWADEAHTVPWWKTARLIKS